jgi:hypothetical protein
VAQDEVIARVGEVPVFASEVAAQAQRTGKAPRAALDDLITFHLLAERWRAAWPPREGEDTHRQILVQRLLEQELEARTRPQDLPDADLRALYQRAIDTFVHPRLVEVAVLDVTVGQRASPEARAEARQTAAALRAAAQAGKAQTPEAFMALAGEERWQSKRVRYFRFVQGREKPYSARFGAEVAKLKSRGELSGVIEDEYGAYLAQYVAERPPESIPFERVREQLREGYYPRWRQGRFQELVQSVRAQHEVELHPDRLVPSPGS